MNTLPMLPVPSDAAVLEACRECLLDLAALRDRDLVITAIVRRARALLGTDMAYMSTNDLDLGETYIHHTDGVRSKAYANIRMPLGAGVLGAVAAGGELVSTHHYLSDAALNHVSDIDRIVAQEGVKTIVGWPMRVGGRVIGALMAAHRSSVQLDRKAIRALELMAQHASIAMEQTRLWAEATKRRLHDDSAELLGVDDRLLSALVSEEGLDAITTVLYETTGAHAAIYDLRGRLLSGTDPVGGVDIASSQIQAFVAASIQGASPARHLLDGVDAVIEAVTARGEHLATLVLHGEAASRLDLRIAGRAAVHVSALLLFERNLVEAGMREQGVIFDELVAGRVDQSLLTQLNAYRLAEAAGASMIVFRLRKAKHYQAISIIQEELAGEGLVTRHSGDICVLGRTDPKVLADALSRHRITYQAGVAPLETWDGAGVAHTLAHRLASAVESLGVRDTIVRSHDLGLAGFVIAGLDEELVASMIEGHIGALLRHDASHQGDLEATALAILEEPSLRLAATRLHVHLNTVRQRIGRIDELMGPAWRDGRTRVDVLFALRLHAIQRDLYAQDR